jgi:hypothetical protein
VVLLGLMPLVAGDLLDRVLVALMQDEELAVGEHLVDEAVEQVRPRLEPLPGVVEAIDLLDEVAEDAFPAGRCQFISGRCS